MCGELEYTGLKALTWDSLRGDTSGWDDRAFYLGRIRELGHPVLDVGCGTGRLFLDYLALGIDIDGIEVSPDMLAILRTKAATTGLDVRGRVHEGAMESMALPRRYRVVLVPSSSFQLIVDPADARAAMVRLAEHLHVDGALIMPWIDIAADHPGGLDERRDEQAILPDGALVRRSYRAWFDAASGLEHSDDQYELVRHGVVVDRQRIVRSPATRHYPRAAIEELHAAAGLVDLRWVSGFSLDPVRDDDRIVTTLALRT